MDDDDQNEGSLGSYVSEAEQACWLAGVAQIPILAARAPQDNTMWYS